MKKLMHNVIIAAKCNKTVNAKCKKIDAKCNNRRKMYY